MYEKTAIEEWLEENNTSPKTNLPLSHNNIIESFFFNQEYKEFLEASPDIERFKLNENNENEKEFVDYLINENYDSAKELKLNNINIYIGDIDIKNYKFFKNHDLIVHFIDNNINFRGNYYTDIIQFICEFGKDESIMYALQKNNYLTYNFKDEKKLIHFICKYASSSIIKYVIDEIYINNHYDIDVADDDGLQSIHYIIKYSTPEMIKYIVEKYLSLGYNLEEDCNTEIDLSPLHFACLFSNSQIIKYMINIYLEQNYDLNCVDDENSTPFHYIGQYGSGNLIKYMIDLYIEKDYDLQQLNDNNMTPLHFICKYSTAKVIKYAIQKYLEIGLSVNDPDNQGWQSIHFICLYHHNNNDLIKYIIDIYVQEEYDMMKEYIVITPDSVTKMKAFDAIVNLTKKSNIEMIKYIMKYI